MDNANPTAANPAQPQGNSLNIPVADASPDQAALDAHINEVLGLPTQEAPKDDSKTDGAKNDGLGGAAADDGAGADDGTNKGEGGAGDDGAAVKTQEELDAAAAEAKSAKASDKGAEQTPPPSAEALTLTVTDKAGKEFVLKPGDDLDAVLSEFDPKSSGQIIKILDDFRQLNADQKAQDEAAAAAQVQADAVAAREAQVEGWDSEISDLQKQNRVPKATAKPGTPEWKTDPAVVRVGQVFELMTKENARRQAAGSTSFIVSFEDALDKLERQELATQLADRTKTDATAADDAAKIKAGRIQGGGTKGNNAPPVYHPGQYTSIYDIPDN